MVVEVEVSGEYRSIVCVGIRSGPRNISRTQIYYGELPQVMEMAKHTVLGWLCYWGNFSLWIEVE